MPRQGEWLHRFRCLAFGLAALYLRVHCSANVVSYCSNKLYWPYLIISPIQGHGPHTFSAMASRKVFNVFELSEMIIQHLEPLEILATATRVCQCWKAVVNESHILQVRLWMRPQTPFPIHPHSFQPFQPKDHKEWNHLGEPHYHGPITLNPFVMFSPPKEIDCEKRVLRLDSGERVMCFIDDKLIESVDDMGKRSLQKVMPSWRRMYLTDPPITIVAAQSRMEICKRSDNPRSIDCCARDEEGIKLGLLKDVADKVTEWHTNGSRLLDEDETLWPSFGHFVISPDGLPDPPVARDFWREALGSSRGIMQLSDDLWVYAGSMHNPGLKIWSYKTRQSM